LAATIRAQRGASMNFYWRQTIVGLLRYAAEQIPDLAERGRDAAEELDREFTIPWLDEAFAVFQSAALHSRNPVYVTGAFYSMRAMEEVERWERQKGGPIHTVFAGQDDVRVLAGGPDILPIEHHDLESTVVEEAERGIVELFERVRRGATLEEALGLFPLIGDETSPH
jgi:hypothetical protein